MVAQHCLIHHLPSSTDEVRRRPHLGAFLDSGRPTRADLRSDQSRASTQGYYFDHEKDCVDDGNNKHDDGSEFNLDDLIEPDEEAEECNQKLKQQQKKQIQQSTMVASSTQSPISSPESSFGPSIGSDTAGQPGSGWTKAQQARLSRRASGNVFETMMHRSMPAGRLLSLDDSIRSCASIEYSDDGPRARRPSIVAVSEYSDDGPRTRRRNQISGMSSMAADNMHKSLPDLGDLISDVLSTSQKSLLDDEGENADSSNPIIYSMFASFDEKRPTRRRASTISCTNNNRGNRRRAPIGTREILQRAKSERILPVASHSLPSGADRDVKSGAPKNGVVSNLPSTTAPEGGRRNLLLRSQSERLERRRMKQPPEQDFIMSTNLHLSLSSIGSRPEQQTPILPTCPPQSASNLSRGGRRVPQRSQSDQLRPVVNRSSMGTITEEGGRTTMNALRRSNNTSHRSDNVSCALLLPLGSGSGSGSGRGRSVPSIRTGVPRSSSLGSHSNNNHSRSNVSDVKFVRNQRHKDPNGQDGRYTGIISNFTGAPNGDGRLDFANGGYYEGEFFHGLRTGTGKLLNKLNGDYYSGDFMDDKMHGVGSMIFCDGSIYKGKFVLGYITEGVMVYPNGASYTGRFRNGKRHCVNGIYVYQDGSIYIGNFENDVVAGHGQMTWKDGSHYVGDWKDGKHDGFGKEFRPDGTICQEGLWHGGDIVA